MRYIITLLLILITTTAFADKIIIPFDIYPKEIQIDFAQRGLKLDLDRNERTREHWIMMRYPRLRRFPFTRRFWGSWGCIENEGTEYFLFPYKPLTRDEMGMIMRIILNCEFKQE
jgi:hypothetical protein